MSRSAYLVRMGRAVINCGAVYSLILNLVFVSLLGAQRAAAAGDDQSQFEICLSRNTDAGSKAPTDSSDQKIQCIATCAACIQFCPRAEPRSFVSVSLPVSSDVSYTHEHPNLLPRFRDPARPSTGPPAEV